MTTTSVVHEDISQLEQKFVGLPALVFELEKFENSLRNDDMFNIRRWFPVLRLFWEKVSIFADLSFVQCIISARNVTGAPHGGPYSWCFKSDVDLITPKKRFHLSTTVFQSFIAFDLSHPNCPEPDMVYRERFELWQPNAAVMGKIVEAISRSIAKR